MLGSFALTDISAKMYSQQNITDIINDPQMRGAKIQQDKDSSSLSWDALSTPMINIKMLLPKIWNDWQNLFMVKQIMTDVPSKNES